MADISEYYIGKGKVYFKATGETAYRHVGNVPTLEFTPALTKLDHFSAMEGTKSKDRSVVTEKSATIRVVMENHSPENIGIAFLGDVADDGAGNDAVDIFSKNAVTGALLFIGENEIGPKYRLELPSVSFTPQNAIGLISEEWNQIEVQGDVLTVGGSFGTITKIADEGETATDGSTATA